MVLAKVRDKKTQVERTVTPKAYSIIPNRYVLLGYEDENGNPVNGPANVDKNTAVRPEKKSATPAVVEDKSGLVEASKMTREDLDRMNQEAIEKARQKAEEEEKKRDPMFNVAKELVEKIEVAVKKIPAPTKVKAAQANKKK